MARVWADRMISCGRDGESAEDILSNGDVCPCRRMPLVVGNIFREPLDRLYGSSELFMGLRDRQRLRKGFSGPVSTCQYEAFPL